MGGCGCSADGWNVNVAHPGHAVLAGRQGGALVPCQHSLSVPRAAVQPARPHLCLPRCPAPLQTRWCGSTATAPRVQPWRRRAARWGHNPGGGGGPSCALSWLVQACTLYCALYLTSQLGSRALTRGLFAQQGHFSATCSWAEESRPQAGPPFINPAPAPPLPCPTCRSSSTTGRWLGTHRWTTATMWCSARSCCRFEGEE